MRFFFYGTLIAGKGDPAGVEALLRDRGPAAASGLLYTMPDPQGWYPALTPGAGMVQGCLYETTPVFGRDALARLDAYEDFDPVDPDGSLYLRSTIVLADRSMAQAYLFNRPLPTGARRIEDGGFHAWLAREGMKAFHPQV